MTNVLIFVDPRPPAGAATFAGSVVQGGGPVGDDTIDDVVSLLAKPLKAALGWLLVRILSRARPNG